MPQTISKSGRHSLWTIKKLITPITALLAHSGQQLDIPTPHLAQLALSRLLPDAHGRKITQMQCRDSSHAASGLRALSRQAEAIC